MGYLDYAGLQYLWGKLKEKFAPKSHSHDDRYYTESEVNTLLASKVHEETITDASPRFRRLRAGRHARCERFVGYAFHVVA